MFTLLTNKKLLSSCTSGFGVTLIFAMDHLNMNRPRISLFTRLFSDEGKFGYIGWDDTEHRGRSLEKQP